MWIRISISLLILQKKKKKKKWKLHVFTIHNQKSIFAYSLCILSAIVNTAKITRAR